MAFPCCFIIYFIFPMIPMVDHHIASLFPPSSQQKKKYISPPNVLIKEKIFKM